MPMFDGQAHNTSTHVEIKSRGNIENDMYINTCFSFETLYVAILGKATQLF